jgi:hypothetical protein
VDALTGERGATAVAAARRRLAQCDGRLAQELALEVALADGREDPGHGEAFAVRGPFPLERGFRSASSGGPVFKEPDPSPLTVVAELVGSERQPPTLRHKEPNYGVTDLGNARRNRLVPL